MRIDRLAMFIVVYLFLPAHQAVRSKTSNEQRNERGFLRGEACFHIYLVYSLSVCLFVGMLTIATRVLRAGFSTAIARVRRKHKIAIVLGFYGMKYARERVSLPN